MIGVDKNLPFKQYSEEVEKRRLKRLESAQDKMELDSARTGQLIAPSAFTSVLKPVRMGQVKKKARSRPKKIKRKSLAKLKKELRTLLHKFIVARDTKKYDGWCPTCKFRQDFQKPISLAAHIFPVGDYPAIQFDEDNIYGADSFCNCAENCRRALWTNYFREWLGPEKYDALEKRGREIRKWDRSELEEKIRHYRSLSQEGV